MIKKLIRILAALLVTGSLPLQAAEVSQEVEASVQKSFTYGQGGGSILSHKFNEYRSRPDGFVLGRYAIDMDAGNYVMSCEAKNAIQEDQSYSCEGGKPGVFDYKVGWDQTPHIYANGARTLYRDVGNGTLELDDALQAYFQSGPASALAGPSIVHSDKLGRTAWEEGALKIPLKTRDDTASFSGRYRPMQDLAVTVAASRRHKHGSMPTGLSLGFNGATELPLPIEWNTDQFSFGAEYATKRHQLSLRYDASLFENGYNTIVWDSPLRLTDQYAALQQYSAAFQSGKGRAAGMPDNKSHMVTLAGGMELPLHTHFSAEASYAFWTARNQMLPYTVNSAMKPGAIFSSTSCDTLAEQLAGFCAIANPLFDVSDFSNMPSQDVKTRIDVTNVFFKVSNKAWERLKVELEYRIYSQKNKSDLYQFAGMAEFDQMWRSDVPTEPERPSIFKNIMAAKFDLELLHSLSMNFGYEVEAEKVTREVPKKRIHNFDVGFVYRPVHNLMVNLSYLMQMRRMNGFNDATYKWTSVNTTSGRYNRTNPDVYIELPGLRRFDQADRNRHRGRLQVQYSGPKDTLLTFNAFATQDFYRPGKGDLRGTLGAVEDQAVTDTTIYIGQMYGLLTEKTYTLGTDVFYPVSDQLDLDLYYEWDQKIDHNRGNQSSADPPVAQNPQDDWILRTNDVSNVGGIELNWRPTDAVTNTLGYEVVASFMHQDPIINPSAAQNLTNGTTFGPLTNRNVRSLPPSRRFLQTIKAGTKVNLLKNLTLVGRYAYEKFDVDDFALGDNPLRTAGSFWLGAWLYGYRAHTASIGLDYKF